MKKAGISLGFLAALFAAGALPIRAQLVDKQPDPLARIREAANTNVTACSATGETLCEQVAPKIIANAQGESPLGENIRKLQETVDGSKPGTPSESLAIAWALAAFRNAGLEVHTEKYGVGSPHIQENVVAEIRGREKADEWVLVGARLDSSEHDPGSFGFAPNPALVIEAARDIQLTGIRPRHSIRFVIFGGGDQSVTGSSAYVKAHRDELDRARAVILYTAGAAPVSGFVLNGRRDIEPGIREAMKPIDSWGAGHHVFDAPLETDSLDFLLEGIPTILAAKASNPSGHHADSNSIDPADLKELKRNTAIIAVTAFGIAESSTPVGPRQTRAEVESLLKASGLDEKMKASGLWPSWESGQRGR